jgi:dTMP kinase
MLSDPHPYPGKLIVVEGIDGSGKTTQLSLLYRWLLSRGYKVFFTEWNSSVLVRRSMRRGKKKDMLTPTTFSLLTCRRLRRSPHVQDHSAAQSRDGGVGRSLRLHRLLARDVARGVHRDWVRAVYSFAPRPDLALYFRVPIEVSLDRLLTGRAKLKYHEAGMDLGLSRDPAESFRLFQSRVLEEYDRWSANSACALSKLLPTFTPSSCWCGVWPASAPGLSWHRRRPGCRRLRSGVSMHGEDKPFYGNGLPNLKVGPLRGSLIVLEGPDGVGRSTQIEQLIPWLELQGYAVTNTGWARSTLLSQTINDAKAGHALTVTTFSLLYAADFADRLENNVIPALRAGFIVIADRYMYTAFARNAVMGADRQWTRGPVRLRADPRPGPLSQDRRRPPHSARPRGQGDGLLGVRYASRPRQRHFDSFVRYQTRLIREYNRLAREFHFTTVDARKPIDHIQGELRRHITTYLERSRLASAANEAQATPTALRR